MFFDRSGEGGKHRALLLFVLGTLLVGWAGSLFTQPNIPTWYAGLEKPAFTPPNWIFAPVWTALYVLMAVAAARVFKITGLKSPELAAWFAQLFLNLCWSALFFELHRLDWALAEILVLDAAILLTTVLFWRRDRLAGLLMLPYLGWTSFATVLNHAVWQLNR